MNKNHFFPFWTCFMSLAFLNFIHATAQLILTRRSFKFEAAAIVLWIFWPYKEHHLNGENTYACVMLVRLSREGMVFSATFNNISILSGRSVLLVEETGVPGETNRSVASYWQTVSYKVHLVREGFELTTLEVSRNRQCYVFDISFHFYYQIFFFPFYTTFSFYI
jgi:hypothetical protein